VELRPALHHHLILCVNFEGIIAILDSYPACTLTFLEIPVYSIYELNKSQGHKDVNQFKEQDEQGVIVWVPVGFWNGRAKYLCNFPFDMCEIYTRVQNYRQQSRYVVVCPTVDLVETKF
jgi:hypothetical protein